MIPLLPIAVLLPIVGPAITSRVVGGKAIGREDTGSGPIYDPGALLLLETGTDYLLLENGVDRLILE